MRFIWTPPSLCVGGSAIYTVGAKDSGGGGWLQKRTGTCKIYGTEQYEVVVRGNVHRLINEPNALLLRHTVCMGGDGGGLVYEWEKIEVRLELLICEGGAVVEH